LREAKVDQLFHNYPLCNITIKPFVDVVA
jgi:hypothetical protein